MKNSGEAGAIRWDWSVPFQNYKWEPIKTINIQQSYSAGYDSSISGGAEGDVGSKQSSKKLVSLPMLPLVSRYNPKDMSMKSTWYLHSILLPCSNGRWLC